MPLDTCIVAMPRIVRILLLLVLLPQQLYNAEYAAPLLLLARYLYWPERCLVTLAIGQWPEPNNLQVL